MDVAEAAAGAASESGSEAVSGADVAVASEAGLNGPAAP